MNLPRQLDSFCKRLRIIERNLDGSKRFPNEQDVDHGSCDPVSLFLRRSEEHTSELQSHHDLLSFPTRRSSDLPLAVSYAAAIPAPYPLVPSRAWHEPASPTRQLLQTPADHRAQS